MRPYLKLIAEGGTLTENEAAGAMQVMLSGEAEPVEIAGFLLGLRGRGETLDELVGLTRAMRGAMTKVDPGTDRAIDLCGTGGDHAGTFNISTAASLVAAGAGVTVAKHGNRAVSSQAGSADVLQALGVNTNLDHRGVERCLQEAGIAFLFAPQFHPALRHVMPVRRQLGVRTVFNVLGPLCNPAGVKRQLVGAFSDETARQMAQVLVRLGAEHVVVVYAHDGLDELSTTSPTTIYQAGANAFSGGMGGLLHQEVQPERFGLERVDASALRGGTREENAEIVRQVLAGTAGPAGDVVTLNAAYALLASGEFAGLPESLEAARASVSSGAARRSLGALVEVSNAVGVRV